MLSTNTGQADPPYEHAQLGFRNYWYPALRSQELSAQRPKRMILLGDPIAFVRRQKSAYALIDECPHRGARLSLGKDEFPGFRTISCRFHGWTFDVSDGRCLAALTDGPDSPVVGKVRVRTFPVVERKGIVWIWLGTGQPVPLEEDVPKLILRSDTLVKVRHSQVYGNWRYHAEGSSGGHFFMLHRDSLSLLFHRSAAYNAQHAAEIVEDPVDGGHYLLEKTSGFTWQETYPSLGLWPPRRPWRFSRTSSRRGQGNTSLKLHGIEHMGIRLPGIFRGRHFPMNGAVYYEWYVPIDETHYSYFQVSCHWPSNILQRLWTHFWYHVWAGPIRKGRFNDQDKSMVRDNTAREARSGRHYPTSLYRPDTTPAKWIEMCNEFARGVGLSSGAKPPTSLGP